MTVSQSKRTPIEVCEEILSLIRPERTVWSEDGFYYRFDEDELRWVADPSVMTTIDHRSRGQRLNDVRSILKNKLSLPPMNGPKTPFFQWQAWGDDWNQGGWRPRTFSREEIVFADGTYNLITGRIDKFEKPIWGPVIDFSVEKLPKHQNDDKRFLELQETLRQVIEEDHLDFFQETMSFIIRPHVHFRHGIWFYGDTGCRKSTVATAILSAPAGGCGISRIGEQALGADHKHLTSSLVGKFANFSDDQPGGQKFVSWFKQYSGCSFFSAEFKYSNIREYANTAKLVSTCNSLPEMVDSCNALASRMIIFPFKTISSDMNAGASIVSSGRELEFDYWSQESTRVSIVKWLIEGARRVEKRGSYKKPDTITNLIQSHLTACDDVRAWISDNVDVGTESDVIGVSELYMAMAEAGLTLSNSDKRKVKKILESMGCESVRANVGGSKLRVFNKIMWK